MDGVTAVVVSVTMHLTVPVSVSVTVSVPLSPLHQVEAGASAPAPRTVGRR